MTIDPIGLPPELRDEFEQITERFEEAWSRGQRPGITEFLPSNNDRLRRVVLRELVHLDLERRIKRGETPTADDYLVAFPELNSEKGLADSLNTLIFRHELSGFQAGETANPIALGNYLLLEKIGAGGMGQVFRARHQRMDRIVAVKLLSSAMANDKAAIARFEREVKVAAKISHPNIVTAYDADHANGVHFLVMEFVQGMDLSAFVKRNGRASVNQAINFILQAAKGLEAAHKAGIIHRDIKPSNLLLDSQGTVKILDMGLARIGQNDGHLLDDLTTTGAMLGTVDFMAPEQAQDTKSADARADIYALGCSLYYLLTGRPTYEGDSLVNKLLAHRDKPIPSLRAARPDVLEPLKAVFEKMIAKKVGDRYQSMRELIADLSRCPSIEDTLPIVSQSVDLGTMDTSVHPILSESTATQKAADPHAGIVSAAEEKLKRSAHRSWRVASAILASITLLAVVIVTRMRSDVKPKEIDSLATAIGATDATKKTDLSGLSADASPVDLERLAPEQVLTKDHSVEVPARKVLAFEKPGFDLWVKETAALPVEEQLKAVSKKLVELNPGFDGKFSNIWGPAPPWIADGVVIGLDFVTDNVTDISPVRALVGLKWFGCAGNDGKLSDLSPLKGMSLIQLTCFGTQVSDLSPLTGMPLTGGLWCTGTRVADLSPLAGMPLTRLNCAYTQISDLSPLKSMELIELNCAGTLISDLSPIEGMTVTYFNCLGTPVFDLSPLKGVRLTGLDCSYTQVSDLSPLKGMPLTTLECAGTRVRDLSPLIGMPLTSLDCGRTLVSDLSPLVAMPLKSLKISFTKVDELKLLKDMKLTTLECAGTRVSDLSPLIGMPLTSLDCRHTLVSDVSPLAAIPLTSLKFSFTKIAELEPLKDMKLTTLECAGTQVSDLTSLQDMPLANLNCDYTKVFDLSLLENCRSLKTLNARTNRIPIETVAALQERFTDCKIEWFRPISDFNAPAFQQWVSDVAALPAEKQVESVSQKLQELNPGFDGKVTPGIENGVVIHLQFLTDAVTDISPLRALAGLSTLDCSGNFGGDNVCSGKLSNLSPLQGMKLTNLSCNNTQIFDLSPLEGHPLTTLNCLNTQLSDLSPLRGMVLTTLRCAYTNVSDLSPLKGMPLKVLACGNSQVFDLTPLTGMPLELLHCSQLTISDLSPLAGMPLATLMLNDTAITDLSPLQGMPLTCIYCSPRRLAQDSLEILRQMKSLTTIGIKWSDPGFAPEEFWRKYDAGEFGKSTTRTKLAFEKPGFEDWVNSVKAMPAEEQLKAVSKKLVELNPGFDGKFTDIHGGGRKIVNGVVTSLDFFTDDVTDISPVRALVGLQWLSCSGNHGKLSDLSPLKGMQLVYLFCNYTQVSDLSPLTGMPLTGLWCADTRVADLSPLEGVPLTLLSFSHTQVSDLSPLKSMKLIALNCIGTPISDLSPIEGMTVTDFWCSETLVSDLSPLKGMPLTKLECQSTLVSDLSPLREMHLTSLDCSRTLVSDLSPLVAMPLKSLKFSFTKVDELEPLKEMKLTTLECAGTQVSDLSPLKDMPLANLNCDYTKVFDLSPLENCQGLKTLNVRTNRIPSETVAALQARFTDCKIEWFRPICDFNAPAFQQWMSDVASLPAEKQVESVGQKLQELNPGFDGKVTPWNENGIVKHLQFLTDDVTDISPVRALVELYSLECRGKDRRGKLSDLSPLKGMKLGVLACNDTQIFDLSPLEGHPLTTLNCMRTPLSNLSPLRGMALTELHCLFTNVSDLSPLEGMPLKVLDCGQSQISDLTPLTGMPLEWLFCSGLKVSDLSPVARMPLTALILNETSITDLSPLQEMQLTIVTFSPRRLSKDNIEILRQMKSLTSIGTHWHHRFPADEFWKKYDAGEFH